MFSTALHVSTALQKQVVMDAEAALSEVLHMPTHYGLLDRSGHPLDEHSSGINWQQLPQLPTQSRPDRRIFRGPLQMRLRSPRSGADVDIVSPVVAGAHALHRALANYRRLPNAETFEQHVNISAGQDVWINGSGADAEIIPSVVAGAHSEHNANSLDQHANFFERPTYTSMMSTSAGSTHHSLSLSSDDSWSTSDQDDSSSMSDE